MNLLVTKNVAERLSLTPAGVWLLHKKGRLSGVMLGGTLVFDARAVATFERTYEKGAKPSRKKKAAAA